MFSHVVLLFIVKIYKHLVLHFQVLLKAATVASQDATNASLKDNWDDTEGYYRNFLSSCFTIIFFAIGFFFSLIFVVLPVGKFTCVFKRN